ncbi:MAG: hypothetical protein ACJ8FT_07070 [Sphingomonas sp.]
MRRSLPSFVADPEAPREWRTRIVLFGLWLALVAWFCATHVFWRDEVRAFSLALSGSSYAEMLGNVHGEGHPALWYLILRGAHQLFPYREVLPVAGALIGIAAMAVLTFFSPFRTIIIVAILFSFYGAFEYVAIARNYGISALVMFAIAALNPRIRGTLWLGVVVALLCNTNVPSCILAAAFMLFRFVEMLTEESKPTRRDWLVFVGNSALAAIGAYLCFRMVYPTFNDAAVSPHLQHITPGSVIHALIDSEWGFSHLGFNGFLPLPMDAILLAIACLGLIRRPAALAAAIAGLVALKLFFYFVYFSYYRHEILYLIFLISLYWMVAEDAGGRWRKEPAFDRLQLVGAAVFVAILMFQCGRLIGPLRAQVSGVPFSRSADVGALLRRPELAGAIVMGDPDTMLEPVRYYADNPIWFLRQQRFGNVVRLARNARHELSLIDILADAQRLHQQTGRPVVFLSHIELQARREEKKRVMFRDATILRPAEVERFWASTRLVAKLRPSDSDEEYDVYVYPR